MCVQEYRGHTDVVRDVKVITSDVFLSASNDWYDIDHLVTYTNLFIAQYVDGIYILHIV